MKSETIGGVPLELSRDYGSLPETGSSWEDCCRLCDVKFLAIWRRLPDGRVTVPSLCEACREAQRAQWIAEHRLPPPAALALSPNWWRRLLNRLG